MKRVGFIFSVIGLLFIPALALAGISTIRESYTNYNSGGSIGKWHWASQTFTTITDYTITAVEIRASKLGDPLGVVTIGIRNTDITGKPVGSSFCSGTTSEIDTLNWYSIKLSGNCDLDNNKKYAIIIGASGDPDKLGLWRNLSGTYTGGSYFESYDTGSTWGETATRDWVFVIWGVDYEIIPIPSDFGLGALNYAGIVWEDFSLLALLGIGLPLGFWIVKRIITIL